MSDAPTDVVDDLEALLAQVEASAIAAAEAAESAGDEDTAREELRSASAAKAVRKALENDLFTSDAGLAYSLAAELVCWERQPLLSPSLIERPFAFATRLPIYREFAIDDPELGTAADFARWKASFRPKIVRARSLKRTVQTPER